MGNAIGRTTNFDSISHVAPVDPNQLYNDDQTETAPLRNANYPGGLINSLAEGSMTTAYDVFQRGNKISRTRPFIGQRKRDEQTGELLNAYGWWTYAEVEMMSRTLGTGMIDLNLVKRTVTPAEAYEPARELSIIGVGSKNRLEWFVIEQAANAYSFTLVPLYDTLGDWAVYYMISETQLTCLAGAASNLAEYFRILKRYRQEFDNDDNDENVPRSNVKAGPCTRHQERDRVETAICFDGSTPELLAAAEEVNVKLHCWLDIMKHVKDKPLAPLRLPNKDSVSTICYSSGTTGVPKGVVITHGAIAANICAAIRGPLSSQGLSLGPEDVYMSYLPLAHVFERLCIHIMLCVGGRLAIYSGDPTRLLADIRLAQPTIFASVPRLYMRINDTVNAGISEHSSVARYLFNVGMEAKIENLRRNGSTCHPLWDRLVFTKVRNIMGGKLRYTLVGGAALDKSIQEKMAVLFCCPLLEGYGLTETLGTTFIRRADDSIYGHIGAPLPCNEIKLVSVPEMNYLVTQNPPAGELCIKGHTVSPSYFRNPELYAENLTKDGWFRTGDIAILLSQGMRVKIVDRRKNIFKLSQGEYIAPERLEAILCQAPLVSQAFVYGDSSRVCLVAIICLDEDEVQRRGGQLRHVTPKGLKQGKQTYDIDWVKLCADEEVRALVDEQMKEVGRIHKLKGFERVSNFYITPEPFTSENGLLTPTFKLKRNVATKEYESILQQLFKEKP